jgi:hypothetical protein
MKPVDAELSAFFSAARAAENPSAEEKAAVRAAVSAALAGSVGATLGAAAAQPLTPAAKALSLAMVMSWVATGAAVGVATSGVAWVAQSALSEEPRVARTVTAPGLSARSTSAPRAKEAAAPVEPPNAELASTTEPVAAPAPVTPPRSNAALANSASGGRERPSASLEAEARGLSAIQAALSRGDGRTALQLLGEQEREFPHGALDQERAAARVLAWCAAGQVEQAILARGRFLNAYPSSPWAKRVRESCAE